MTSKAQHLNTIRRPSPPRDGIRKRGRPVTPEDLAALDLAISYLSQACSALSESSAHHARDYAARAKKSALGAYNHARAKYRSDES